MNLLKNKWLIGGILIYLISLTILFQSDKYSAEEAIFALLIFGFFFSSVAWLFTKRARTLEFSIDPTTKEILFLAGFIVFVFFYLIFGIIWIRTRNLFALIFIHAITDLLPNLAEFIKVWKI